MFETMKQRNIDEQMQLAKKDAEIVKVEESKEALRQEISAFKEGNQEKDLEVSRLNDEITALKEAYQKIKASYNKIKAANASRAGEPVAKDEGEIEPQIEEQVADEIEPGAANEENSKVETEITPDVEQG